MSDDKSKQDARDRNQVAADEDYELDYFAEKHGLTRAEARALIEKHGNGRVALDAAATRQRSE